MKELKPFTDKYLVFTGMGPLEIQAIDGRSITVRNTNHTFKFKKNPVNVWVTLQKDKEGWSITDRDPWIRSASKTRLDSLTLYEVKALLAKVAKEFSASKEGQIKLQEATKIALDNALIEAENKLEVAKQSFENATREYELALVHAFVETNK